MSSTIRAPLKMDSTTSTSLPLETNNANEGTSEEDGDSDRTLTSDGIDISPVSSTDYMHSPQRMIVGNPEGNAFPDESESDSESKHKSLPKSKSKGKPEPKSKPKPQSEPLEFSRLTVEPEIEPKESLLTRQIAESHTQPSGGKSGPCMEEHRARRKPEKEDSGR